MSEVVNFLGADLQAITNISVGGNADIDGNARVGHNLIVEGWLEAPNIKDSNKGIFATLSDLELTYPTPQNGWFAFVGTANAIVMYIGQNGAWTNTNNTLTITTSISQIETALQGKQDRLTAGTGITIDANNVISATNSSTIANNKADKVTNATNGNLAGLDSTGNLTDSGYAASDVADAIAKKHGHANKTLLDLIPANLGTQGQMLVVNSQGTGLEFASQNTDVTAQTITLPAGATATDYATLENNGAAIVPVSKKPIVSVYGTDLTANGDGPLNVQSGYTYICNDPITDMQIVLQSPASTTDYLAEYHIIFATDTNTAPTITGLNNLHFENGVTPVFQNGRRYEINILAAVDLCLVTEYDNNPIL